MRTELKIDSELESIIPRIDPSEFEQLEKNILEEGRIIDPIIVWKGTIVDGHNRYRIASRHPEIEFEILEKAFESKQDCLDWICFHQLGRRNLDPINRKYLIGRLYNSTKKRYGDQERFNARYSPSGQIDHLEANFSSRQRVAELTNTTPGYVRHAGEFAQGLDVAEESEPGVREKVLSREIKPTASDVSKIAKLSEDERKQRVEELLTTKEKPVCKPAKENKKKESVEQDSGLEAPSTFDVFAEIPLRKVNSQERETDIEDSILQSMVGAANMFISSCNNFFTRFPKLRTEEKYRKQALEIMQGVENYITEIREDLQNESN